MRWPWGLSSIVFVVHGIGEALFESGRMQKDFKYHQACLDHINAFNKNKWTNGKKTVRQIHKLVFEPSLIPR
jgi:hypothetical protein